MSDFEVFKLTQAQRSALECADLEDAPTISAAWSGAFLSLEHHEIESAASELTDLANSEDGFDIECRRRGAFDAAKGARGARGALTNLSAKILGAR